jgi:PTH1 family peptidyl-tRNA hydrolase
MSVDKLAQKLEIEINKNKFNGLFGEGLVKGNKIVLLKPQTFMNLSGESVEEIVSFYKIPLSNLIVIYDDIDIEFGRIRVRPEGSSGTHNGMRSVSDTLDSHDFPRIRVGIGKPTEELSLADYVLKPFNEDERKIVNDVTNMAADAVIEIIENGVNQAMCIYN